MKDDVRGQQNKTQKCKFPETCTPKKRGPPTCEAVDCNRYAKGDGIKEEIENKLLKRSLQPADGCYFKIIYVVDAEAEQEKSGDEEAQPAVPLFPEVGAEVLNNRLH